jgi:hypothetical protein
MVRSDPLPANVRAHGVRRGSRYSDGDRYGRAGGVQRPSRSGKCTGFPVTTAWIEPVAVS